ncbi:hypothetical protein [Parachryseolinea silvisoli]|uniref:hypothetical protein n=1 Tax=Parachryseolinea silvisoli TaxID=2873601 RepID=UPI00226592F5|nr:hypothetical protein [Parachryseolinea silvisoli]MCD9015483.1 hypothetical protein [Parachryseolinea silvisoli]
MANKIKCIQIQKPGNTRYQHEKCYAKGTGNCSTKISGEHVISHVILRSLEKNGKVKIIGLPWQKKGHFGLLPTNTLKSNILCSTHNSILSEFDSEMGRFFKTLIDNDQNLISAKPESNIAHFCGYDLERWMLKVLCGFIASNQIANFSGTVKDLYVDILFNNMPFPHNWGLYISPLPLTQIDHSFGFMPLMENGDVLGVEFLLNNVRFYLLLGTPGGPSFGMYHPAGIESANNGFKRRIEIYWPNDSQENLQGIYLHSTGKTSKGPPREWPDEWKQ